MFHSFLNFLVFLAATRPFLRSSFFLSSSKRPSTFLHVVLYIISSISFPLPLSSVHPIQSKHTHTVVSGPADSEIHRAFGDERIKSEALRTVHVASGRILKRKFHVDYKKKTCIKNGTCSGPSEEFQSLSYSPA